MWNWENGLTWHEEYYSRYIASYRKMCDELKVPFYRRMFRQWLEEIGLCKEEVNDICNMADNGKLEFEEHAKRFLTREFGKDK